MLKEGESMGSLTGKTVLCGADDLKSRWGKKRFEMYIAQCIRPWAGRERPILRSRS